MGLDDKAPGLDGFPKGEDERIVLEAIGAAVPNLMALGYTTSKFVESGTPSALAIAAGLSGGLQRLFAACGGKTVGLLAVDRRLFESDVRSSALFELAAGRLLPPYEPLVGASYLEHWDGVYKRRKIVESLTALALEHPDLVSEIYIDKRYFVHDNLLRLLPQAPSMLKARKWGQNEAQKGYDEALTSLSRDGLIHIVDDLITIDKSFFDLVPKKTVAVSDQLTKVQRQLLSLLRLGPRGFFDLLQLMPHSFENLLPSAFRSSDISSPERFLHFPTATGLTPLSISNSVDEMIARVEPSDGIKGVRLDRFGSVLNEVYLLSYSTADGKRKVILKRYPNWVSLKWAPLALWTLGTQNFAILGRSRMERECATTAALLRSGISVPRILQTSFEDRFLIRDYVVGRNLVEIVKSTIQRSGVYEDNLRLIRLVGRSVSKVHGSDVTLGDCKPENFIVAPEEIFIVDLEQGGRGGNATWDLVEFLYFSGHYANTLDPLEGVIDLTKSFIAGYLEAGGDRRRFVEAARLKYAKVFTPLTLPHVIYTIAKTCRSEAR
jgi:tRNA A-37 threonylcarbamoyl transferase component Bud32